MEEMSNYSVMGKVTLNIYPENKHKRNRKFVLVNVSLAVATRENKFSMLTCEIKNHLTLTAINILYVSMTFNLVKTSSTIFTFI